MDYVGRKLIDLLYCIDIPQYCTQYIYSQLLLKLCQVGVMKMGNIVPSLEIESISCLLGQCAKYYTLMSAPYPCLSMQLVAWEVSADYYPRSPGIVSLLVLTITSKQVVLISHIHTQGRFHNHTSHSFYSLLCLLLFYVLAISSNIIPDGGWPNE